MNHGFKLHPDGTLEITMPKGKKVSRVLVCEAGTQNGTLMYPDCDDCIKHGGDWECSHVHCHKDNNPDTNVGDMISRRAAIDALMERDKKLRNINWYDKPYAEGECRGIDEALSIISNLPSVRLKHVKTIKDVVRLFEPCLTTDDLLECLEELRDGMRGEQDE